MYAAERIILYVIYQKDGVLDNWYETLFQEFHNHGSYFLCVVNGFLNTDSRQILDKYFNKVLYRENTGYDVTAYKEGILFLYQEALLDKELIICNNSFFAPIYPFKDMFDTMNKKDYDFWGITSIKADGQIPYHIQSYFYLFKTNVIKSNEFIQFFMNMKKIKSYQNAVNYVELKLTNYLLSYGYKAGSYMDEIIDGSYSYDLLSLIKNGCPVLKRRKLIYSKKYGYNHGINNSYLLSYIEDNTSFDVNEIYKNLCKEFPFDYLDFCLSNTYILDNHIYNEIEINNKIKYIVSYNEKSKEILEQLKNKYNFINGIEYINTNNIKDVFDVITVDGGYDYYVHAGLIWREFLSKEINFIFLEYLFLSIFGNKNYQKNIINHLNNHKYIAMCFPLDFFHGIKFNHIFSNKKIYDDIPYNIIRKEYKNIPHSKERNILALSSSFIINKEMVNCLANTDYSLIKNDYSSYIDGGILLRYLSHSKGKLSIKITERELAGKTIQNYLYKYSNDKLEDSIKSWWLTNKLRNQL